jgi:MFS family permease
MPGSLPRLILTQVCVHATMTGTRLAAPLLALKLGYSAEAVGVLIALFALTQVFLALPAGRFADRHGLRRPIGIAVVCAVAGTSLAAGLPMFGALCVAALLTGAASGITVIALQRHIGRVAKGRAGLRRGFSWLSIAPAAANFVGPFSAGLLIDHAGPVAGDMAGYRWAFGALVLLPLVAWLLIRREPEVPVTPSASASGDAKPGPASIAGIKPRAWHLLRDPMLRRLFFVNWLQSSSWDLHTFMLPLLGHDRGLSASTIGAILGAFAIAAAAVRVALPVIAARLDERDVITISTVTTALVFAVYPFTSGALSMGACSVMLGFALGAVQPMVMTMLHHMTPPDRHGEALGLRAMMLNASSVAMPVLVGTTGTLLGVAAPFWIVASVVAWGTRAVRRLDSGAVAT